MQGLVNNYLKKQKEYRKQKDKLNKEIRELKDELAELKEERQQLSIPSWIDEIINPLAEKLADKTGLYAEVFGPFGINNRTTIYLKKEDIDITDTKTISLTLRPIRLVKGTFQYETNKETDKYKEGTIAEMNGGNTITKELKDYSINNILNIMFKQNDNKLVKTVRKKVS